MDSVQLQSFSCPTTVRLLICPFVLHFYGCSGRMVLDAWSCWEHMLSSILSPINLISVFAPVAMQLWWIYFEIAPQWFLHSSSRKVHACLFVSGSFKWAFSLAFYDVIYGHCSSENLALWVATFVLLRHDQIRSASVLMVDARHEY